MEVDAVPVTQEAHEDAVVEGNGQPEPTAADGNGATNNVAAEDSDLTSDEDDDSNKQGLTRKMKRTLFVSGLKRNIKIDDTVTKQLNDFFEKFGVITKTTIAKDPQSRSRGYGFVVYQKTASVAAALNSRPHRFDGKVLFIRRTVPKDDYGKEPAISKSLFIGNLKDDIEESDLREHFKKYGNILKVRIVKDKLTQKKKFAQMDFEDFDPVDRIIVRGKHRIRNHQVSVKWYMSKEDMINQRERRMMEGGEGGGPGGWFNGRNEGSYAPPPPPDYYGGYGGGYADDYMGGGGGGGGGYYGGGGGGNDYYGGGGGGGYMEDNYGPPPPPFGGPGPMRGGGGGRGGRFQPYNKGGSGPRGGRGGGGMMRGGGGGRPARRGRGRGGRY